MRAARRLGLALVLVVSSPGIEGWRLSAQDQEYAPTIHDFRAKASVGPTGPAQPQAQRLPEIYEGPRAGAGAPKVKAALQRIANDPRLAEDQRQQAVDFLSRYQSALAHDDKKAQAALDDVVKDLSDPKKDPGLSLASMFDRLQQAPRDAEANGTVVQYMHQDAQRTLVRVGSTVSGKTLFYQDSRLLTGTRTLKTITRPDED